MMSAQTSQTCHGSSLQGHDKIVSQRPAYCHSSFSYDFYKTYVLVKGNLHAAMTARVRDGSSRVEASNHLQASNHLMDPNNNVVKTPKICGIGRQ